MQSISTLQSKLQPKQNNCMNSSCTMTSQGRADTNWIVL